jgi:P-type E1-E2 ATPase
LKVLGRANPLDKHILATGLRSLGKVVAVTGEGINDVDALRTADVGFAMGSGVSVAKDVADMVLTKDDFESTMMAVMWGRNIYANTRKFLQFQLTANFTALIVVFIGAVTKGTATFGVVQLLWLNLIMDTFAAVALGSEKPHPSIIKSPPIKENEQIMTITMWR